MISKGIRVMLRYLDSSWSFRDPFHAPISEELAPLTQNLSSCCRSYEHRRLVKVLSHNTGSQIEQDSMQPAENSRREKLLVQVVVQLL